MRPTVSLAAERDELRGVAVLVERVLAAVEELLDLAAAAAGPSAGRRRRSRHGSLMNRSRSPRAADFADFKGGGERDDKETRDKDDGDDGDWRNLDDSPIPLRLSPLLVSLASPRHPLLPVGSSRSYSR